MMNYFIPFTLKMLVKSVKRLCFLMMETLFLVLSHLELDFLLPPLAVCSCWPYGFLTVAALYYPSHFVNHLLSLSFYCWSHSSLLDPIWFAFSASCPGLTCHFFQQYDETQMKGSICVWHQTVAVFWSMVCRGKDNHSIK